MSKKLDCTTSPGFVGTYSGQRVNLFDPDPNTIDIMDIAHALSGMLRYNGHLKESMSVAQHCVMVSYFPKTKEAQLHGLLHDGEEAYFVDLPRPIKYLPGFEEFRRLSKNFNQAIYQKFGVNSSNEFTAEIKLADDMSLAWEALHFMNHDAVWAQKIADSNLSAYKDMCQIYATYGGYPVVWDRTKAKIKFLERFYYLHSEPFVI